MKIRKYLSYAVLVLCAVLVCSDIVLFFNPAAGPVSSALYVTLWFLVMFYGGIAAGALTLNVIRKPSRAGIFLMWLIFVLLVAWTLPHSRAVSGEATQEVTCGMRAITKGWDGWQSTCFFGYPVRQYVAMAIPTVFWGRNIASLRLGIALPFVLSLAIYIAGLYEAGGSVIISLVAAGLLMHSGFVIRFLFWYEQSILPLTLVMASVGAYLLYRSRKNPVHLVMGIASAALGATVYTPMLAFLPFAAGALLLEAKHRVFRLYAISGIAILVASYAIPFLYRADLRLTSGGIGKIPFRDLLVAIEFLTYKTSYYPFGSWIFRVAIFVAIGMLFLFFGVRGKLTGLWVLGTMAASVVSAGYAWYGVDFRMHRSMVMYPVLFCAFLALKKWLPKHAAVRGIAACIAVGIVLSGSYVAFSYGLSHQSNIHGAIVNAVLSLYGRNSPDQTASIRVALLDREYDTIKSLADELHYILPRSETRDDTQILATNSCALSPADLIVINSKNPCYDSVIRNAFDKGYDYRMARSEDNEFFIYRPIVR